MSGQARHDGLLALAVGLVACAVYQRTLYPGLVGSGDTPELQFAGRVLGTPHTPGYPLYTLVSWAFAHLPWGNPAWRINLMSAVFGGVAAALATLALRRLGCRPAVAAATALALACGRVFWSQATLAEVYTLAAALLLGVVVCLLAWAETRREAMLLAAVGCVALALGHHYSDIVTAAPAFVLFALWTDRRAALRGRVLGVGVLLVALGPIQYVLVLLRTRQGASYLASRAATLGELFSVMRGGQFGHRLFVFDLRTVLAERLPSFGRLLRDELGLVGLSLLALGFAVLVRHRPREAALFALGAAGPAFFALNYDVPDVAVFLIPAFVLLWPVVGVGLEALLSALPRGVPRAAAAALALLLPAAQLAANYRASDHHARTFEMRYFRAVFEALPAKAALVTESYAVDQMVRYELLGEGYAAQKAVALSGRDAESLEAFARKGYALFAFERGQQELAARGFVFAPLVLSDLPLEGYLQQVARGSLVLVAGVDPGRGCAASIRVAGSDGVRREGAAAEVSVAVGERIGASSARAPVSLRALCRGDGGLVEVGGKLMARVDGGVAVAIANAAGRVLERLELPAEDGLVVPFSRRAFPLYRLVRAPICADIGNRGMVDVSEQAAEGRLLGIIDNLRSFNARLVVYLAGDRPLSPRFGFGRGRGDPELAVEDFASTGRLDPALRDALRQDGVPPGHPLTSERFVARVEVGVNDRGESSAFAIDLGGLPRRALAAARVDRDEPWRARLCALPVGEAPLFADARSLVARIPLGAQGAPHFGAGWHPSEWDGPTEFRWTSGSESEVLLSLARSGTLSIEVRAMPPAEEGSASSGLATLTVRVNGHDAGARPLQPGWMRYEWTVPEEAWRVGPNQILLHVSRVRPPTPADSRSLGVAVGRLRLQRVSP